MKNPYCSVVIPFYNEVDSIAELYQRLTRVFESLGRSYELVFIDDGSTDNTLENLKHVYEKDTNVRVVALSRNFGQTAALAAGFAQASGEVIVAMDGDLQNRPEEIPLLLEKIEEGYDIVSGRRIARKESYLTKRVPSIVANWMMRKLSGIPLKDFGGTFKAYRSFVIKNIRLYGELHRFIPAIASSLTNKIAEVPITSDTRRHGQSKYGLSRVFRVMFDLVTVKFLMSFSTRPLHMFGLLGLVSGGSGFVVLVYMALKKLLLRVDIGTEPMLLLGAILLIIGVQFVSLGVIAEMVVRTYYESQDKKIYFVHKVYSHQADEDE